MNVRLLSFSKPTQEFAIACAKVIAEIFPLANGLLAN